MPEEKVLIIEDDQSMRWVLEKSLTKEGYLVETASGGIDGLSIARRHNPDLVILDILIPDMDGLTVLKRIKESKPSLPVLIITAQNIMSNAIEAMRHGAFDYLPKPFDIPVLLEYVARGLALAKGEGTPAGATQPLPEKEDMIGRSPIMEDLFKAMGRVAATEATVLILGESGSGKELVARAIHRFSGRSGGPFIAVNASAIPGELLESVLFGHEKGAFTGATETRKGKFELAKGGTLFLDEIGDMPMNLQAKILRVLENREFERVGGHRSITANVRTISATHRDLREAVSKGEFREDLYYRLNVVSLHVPPLRERREDIPVLSEHFLRVFAEESGHPPKRLSKDARALLIGYPWPGNVRELMNTIRRASVLTQGQVIQTEDLELDGIEKDGDGENSFEEVLRARIGEIVSTWSNLEEGDLYDQLLTRMEKPLFELTLEASGGNQFRAARILGINRNTLRERLRKYGLLGKRGKKRKGDS
ncbi:MAG: sigma-54-dependent Fis family transcriptional regulator [Deltaproteobacteria bacterium]|nr:sigma-54-dependent Fis family transcriptional regulator [Deltaproteobacteria bacterium]